MTHEQLLIENERMRFALASLLDWWEGLPNDTRGDLGNPAAIDLACEICDGSPSSFAKAMAFGIVTQHGECLQDDVNLDGLIDDIAAAIDRAWGR